MARHRFWCPSPRARRDRHLAVAQEFMELACRNLELAAEAAAEMGDQALSGLLGSFRSAHLDLFHDQLGSPAVQSARR